MGSLFSLNKLQIQTIKAVEQYTKIIVKPMGATTRKQRKMFEQFKMGIGEGDVTPGIHGKFLPPFYHLTSFHQAFIHFKFWIAFYF